MFKSRKSIAPYWFTPEDQEDLDGAEQPLKFKLRGLRATEKSDIQTLLLKDGKATPNVFRECFLIGCIDIANAEKANGKPCKHPEAFLALPDSLDYAVEAGAEVFMNTFESEEEKKTSSSE